MVPSDLKVEVRSGQVVVSTGKIAFMISAAGSALLENVRLFAGNGTSDPTSAIAQNLTAELMVAPITMVGRVASKGKQVLPVSSADGLSAGDSIEILDLVLAQVARPGEDTGLLERFPLHNRRGGSFVRLVPYPSPSRYPPGTKLVVAKGAPNEETVTVAGAEPDASMLVLVSPLRFDHQPYEKIETSRSAARKVTRILDTHRIVVDTPLERDHGLAELVIRQGGDGAATVFRPKLGGAPVVEESGPVKATIKVRGQFEGKDGGLLMGGEIEFAARITAYAGRDDVKIAFTLENNGPYGFDADSPGEGSPIASWLFMRDLSLHLGLSLAAPVTASTDRQAGAPSVVRAIALSQHHLEVTKAETANFFFRVGRDGAVTERAGRLSGWLDVSDRGRGVTVAVRDFWQNYPKRLSFAPGRLTIGLWPEGGHYPDAFPRDVAAARFGYYAFEGGRHKTHEISLRFHQGSMVESAARQYAGAAITPLVAVLPGSWYASSKALGLLAPASMRPSDPTLAEALARYEKFQLARVHRDQAEDPRVTIHAVREKEPGVRYYHEKLYGWMNFGDLPWAEGYSSLHYDWPYGMLLQFIRTGDPAFFDLGREMALHRVDIDHIHGNRGHRGGNPWKSQYLQRYESDAHGYDWPQNRPRRAHTWSGGMALYYLLTGDRRGLEATREVADAAREYWKFVLTKKTPMSYHEIRRQGWSILNLIHVYRITGDRGDLEMANALFHNSLLHLEQLSGGEGHWAIEGDPSRAYTLQTAFVLDPLIQLHEETSDPAILALLRRVAEWSRREIILGGDTKEGKYRPLGSPSLWERGKPSTRISPLWNLFFADLFAYLHLRQGAPQDLPMARRLFRDVAFWFTYPGDYLQPSLRSPVSYTVHLYTGTETKIGAWFAKYPQTYLHAEWLLLGPRAWGRY
jgi:hypothetical protein